MVSYGQNASKLLPNSFSDIEHKYLCDYLENFIIADIWFLDLNNFNKNNFTSIGPLSVSFLFVTDMTMTNRI